MIENDANFAEFAEWYERQDMGAQHEDSELTKRLLGVFHAFFTRLFTSNDDVIGELIKRMFIEADVDGGGSLDRQVRRSILCLFSA